MIMRLLLISFLVIFSCPSFGSDCFAKIQTILNAGKVKKANKGRVRIRSALENNEDLLWADSLTTGKLPDDDIIAQRLEKVLEVEEEINGLSFKSSDWEIDDPWNSDLEGRALMAIPDYRKNSGGTGSKAFLIAKDSIVHVPSSPDTYAASYQPFVYFFKDTKLIKRITLDEWILLNFKNKLAENIVLYRSMSKLEGDLFITKKAKKIITLMNNTFKKGLNDYDLEVPVLHFSAEIPISWSAKEHALFRFDLSVSELIKMVKKGQARVNLYGPMIEVQLKEKAIPMLMDTSRRIKSVAIENMTSEEIAAFLKKIDQK